MKKLISLISLIALTLFVSGCQNTPQPPKEPIIDQTLPMVNDIKFLSDITEVGFEWKSKFDERVKGYYIYRSNPNSENGKLQRVKTLKDKYSTHFVDTKLKPQTQYIYRFSTYSDKLRESVPSKTIRIQTLPTIESVSYIKAITGLPHRIKIIWRPQTSPRVEAYLIQKNKFSSTKWEQIAKVEGRLNAEYIDSGLEDNRVFRYRIIVKTYDGLLSRPSKIVEAGTKPLPKEIKALNATIDLPKKIVLNWQESSAKDFSYYKIYRTLNPLLFYSYLAKTKTNNYEDLINENGKAYYYLVTAVDKDGLESLRQKSAIAGSTLSIPTEVYITSSNHDSKSINIKWKTKDDRAMKFDIVKEFSQKGSSKKQIITAVRTESFTDNDVVSGIEYTYQVLAIDKYGLSSKPSEKIIIEIPKN